LATAYKQRVMQAQSRSSATVDILCSHPEGKAHR